MGYLLIETIFLLGVFLIHKNLLRNFMILVISALVTQDLVQPLQKDHQVLERQQQWIGFSRSNPTILCMIEGVEGKL